MQDELEQATSMDAEDFQVQLQNYVRAELRGEETDRLYPDVVFLLKTSDVWREAYYQEFYQQGMLLPSAALQALSHSQRVTATLDQILGQISATKSELITPLTNWIEKTIEYGRAWLDQMGRLRSAELRLPTFQLERTPASATLGLLDATKSIEASAYRTLYIHAKDANFRVILNVEADPEREGRYQMEATITLLRQQISSDFANIQLMLVWGTSVYPATTDPFGKAVFVNLPPDVLTSVDLQMLLPDPEAS